MKHARTVGTAKRIPTWYQWGLALFLFIAVGHGAQAQISTPPQSFVATTNIMVPVDNTASVPLLWNIHTTAGPFIRSDEIRIIAADASTVAVFPTVINQNAAAGSTRIFTETAIIPVSVLKAAARRGPAFVIARRFYDGELTETDFSIPQPILLTSSAVANFAVSRQTLAFDDRSVTRIMDVNQRLRATAEINYVGTGLLQGVWEVADTPGTAGQPFFRVIGTVSEYFMDRRARYIRSPWLPTHQLGLQLVRFRITSPAPGFEPPTLQYFVGHDRLSRHASRIPLALLEPPDLAVLGTKTTFHWRALKHAKAYKLELFPQADTAKIELPDLSGSDTPARRLPVNKQRPVTGIMVPGTVLGTPLTGVVRERLKPASRYFWRITAFDRDGATIGVSEWREIITP